MLQIELREHTKTYSTVFQIGEVCAFDSGRVKVIYRYTKNIILFKTLYGTVVYA